MKSIYSVGDTITLEFIVKETDIAHFETGMVHPVYSTFALGRDAEWTTRQFVLNMKEAHEEGIGTYLTIKHQSPAILHSKVTIVGRLESIIKNEIICSYVVSIGERIIATGETGQKILSKDRLDRLFEGIKN